jgi:hypothetical protein
VDFPRSVPIKKTSLNHFDYLVLVFLNIGNFYKKNLKQTNKDEPEIFVLPVEFVKKNIIKGNRISKINSKKLDLAKFQNNFELIAKQLKIKYPSR